MTQSGSEDSTTGVTIVSEVGPKTYVVYVGHDTVEDAPLPTVNFPTSSASHTGTALYTVALELSAVAQETVYIPLSFSGTLIRGTDYRLVADDGNPYTREFVAFTAGTQTLQINIELLNQNAGSIVIDVAQANSSATLDKATIGTSGTFTMTANPGAQISAQFESTNTTVQQSVEELDVAIVLSEAAVVPVAVTVSLITSDQLDGAISSTTVPFAVGEDRATVGLTWSEDTADRGMLIRITDVTPGSIGTTNDHQVTITAPAVTTTAITVPSPGPTIAEGATADLVLTFGAAAAADFNIAVSRSGTATPEQYAITWPGLVDVFPVSEGDTEFRLPIQRIADDVATGDRTLIFTLAAATANQYTLTNTEVTVTLQDDDAQNPTVGFEVQNYTTNQGTARNVKVVCSPAPTSDLTISVTSGGNAPSGDLPITWPGGVADEVTIPSGQTEVNITATPTENGQTTNTERTFALVAAPGTYNIGQYGFTSLVIEPEISATYDGDTEVEYDQMPGTSNTFVRLVVPIDPTDEASLPAFELEGVKAGVHAHTRRWDRKVDNVLVHALVPHRSGDPAVAAKATLRPTSLADPASNQFYDLALPGFQLEMLTNAGNIRCYPFALEMESRESWWCSEKKYWAQFEIIDGGVLAGDARPCGLVTTVRRRSDIDLIEFEFRFCFDVYNLSDTEGHREYRSSTGGALYARYIRVKSSTIPSGTIFGDSFEDQFQDGVDLVKAGPAANDWHRFDAGTSLIRSFYIAADTVTVAQANAAQNLHGLGYPSNGHYSAHKRPNFGAGGRYVGRYSSAYTRNGYEGREALRNIYAGVAATEIGHALNGTNGNGFNSGPGHETGASGFWHPYGESSYENGGGNEIVFTSGQQYLREEVVHKMILARYSLYRNAVGLTNYFTGEQISAADLAASNNGKMPWAIYGEDNDHRRTCPHFYHNADFTEGGANTPRVHARQAPNGDDTSTRGRAPTTHLWNQPGDISANILEPIDANPFVRAEGAWSFAGIDHLVRDTMTYESPAWHGELMYMDLVNRRAQWAMRSHTRFDVDPEGVVSGFVYRSECIPAAVAVLNKSASRKFWGGGAGAYGNVASESSLQFIARGIGHLMHTVAIAGRFATGGTWDDMHKWARDFSHLADLRLSPYGQGSRTDGSSASHPAGIQGYPDDPCQFGVVDLVNNIGAVPTGWGLIEFHMEAYAARGFGDVEYTFRPRAQTGVYESGQVVAYKRMVIDSLQRLFSAGYGAGDKRPPGWVMVSTADDGEPDGAIGSGDDAITNGRSYRPWTFRRATEAERTTLGCPGDINTGYQIYGGMTGQLGPWLSAAISFARINGLTGITFSDYLRTTEEAAYEDDQGSAIVYANMTDVANSMLNRIAVDQDWISPVSQFRATRWPMILGEIQSEAPAAVAPVVPSLDYLNPGDASVAVDWTPGVGGSPQDEYVVQWRTDAGTYNTINQAVLGSAVRTHNVQGLTNDTLYWFRVGSREVQEGLISWAAEASATPVAGAGNVDAPQNFQVTSGATQAGVSWDLTDVNDTMVVLYSTTPDVAGQASPNEAWFGTNKTSGTVWGLVDGTTYYMVVVVRDGQGVNGPASEEWFVIPGAGGSAGPVAAPNPPSNPQAVPLNGGMLVTWDPPA